MQVPELLPDVAAQALKNVGIEVLSSSSREEDEEEAVAAIAAASAEISADGSVDAATTSPSSTPSAAVAIEPQHLPDLWQQELEAWSLLLDGSALNQHMEVGAPRGSGVRWGGAGWAVQWAAVGWGGGAVHACDPTLCVQPSACTWLLCGCVQPLYLQNLRDYLEAMARDGQQEGGGGGNGSHGSSSDQDPAEQAIEAIEASASAASPRSSSEI